MRKDYRETVYNTLKERDTEELLDIWQKNDRYEWSDVAFDAIKQILLQRLGEIPEQGEPIYDQEELKTRGEEKSEQEEENEPVFYKPRDVLALELWLNRAAIAMVVIAILINLLNFGNTRRIVLGLFATSRNYVILEWVIALVLTILNIIVGSVIYYFSLKALSSILKILMEMEFNSRSGE